jgi:hypothetical protein
VPPQPHAVNHPPLAIVIVRLHLSVLKNIHRIICKGMAACALFRSPVSSKRGSGRARKHGTIWIKRKGSTMR